MYRRFGNPLYDEIRSTKSLIKSPSILSSVILSSFRCLNFKISSKKVDEEVKNGDGDTCISVSSALPISLLLLISSLTKEERISDSCHSARRVESSFKNSMKKPASLGESIKVNSCN